MAIRRTFALDDMVAHKADSQSFGIITGVVTRTYGVFYLVTWNDRIETQHHASELEESTGFESGGGIADN